MHDFDQSLLYSEGIALWDKLAVSIMAGIPGAQRIIRSSTADDKNGTDYWVYREHGLPPVSVDVKHRGFDPVEKGWGDDACIETTSVYEGKPSAPWFDENRKKIGWTLDERKRTDLVVYTWPTSDDERRYWILYFPHLCSASRLLWKQWASRYGERPAVNNGYLTLCVYPPRSVIAKAMREFTVGVTA